MYIGVKSGPSNRFATLKVTLSPFLCKTLLIVLKYLWSWERGSDVLSRGSQNCRIRGLSSWRGGEGRVGCDSSYWIILGWALKSNNEGNKISARDSCGGTVGLSVNGIGLSVKDWKILSFNGFGGWSCKTTGEIGGEEEESRVIRSGSVGNFESSGDDCWPSQFRSAANRARRVPARKVVGRPKSKKEYNNRI